MSKAPPKQWYSCRSSELKQIKERILQDKASYQNFLDFIAVAMWDMFVYSHDVHKRHDLENHCHLLQIDCLGFQFQNENDHNAVSMGDAGINALFNDLRAMRARGPIVMTLKEKNAFGKIIDKSGSNVFSYNLNSLFDVFPEKYHTCTPDGRGGVKF